MALTLRSVAGLTVPEIARAFLSTEQRDGAPADAGAQQGHRRADPVPGAAATTCWSSGSRACCASSTSSSTRATRRRARELRAEAIRLARLLVRLMPDEAEVARAARAVAADRRALARRGSSTASWCRWPSRTARCGIARRSPRASRVLERALRLPRPGAVRDPGRDRRRARRRRRDFAATDWAQIAGLYARAARHDPVAGGGASTARSRSGSPTGRRPGSRCCPTIRASTATPPLHAARFELLRRAGDVRRPPTRRFRPRSSSPPTTRRARAALRAARQRERRSARRPARARRRRASRARSRPRTTRSRPRRRTPRRRSRSRTRRRARAACCRRPRPCRSSPRATALTAALVVAGIAIETPAPATISAGHQLDVGPCRVGDERDPGEAGGLQREPGDQERPLAEAVDERARDRRDEEQRRRPRQQPQAGAERVVAEHGLQELGEEEDRAEQRREHQEARRRCRPRTRASGTARGGSIGVRVRRSQATKAASRHDARGDARRAPRRCPSPRRCRARGPTRSRARRAVISARPGRSSASSLPRDSRDPREHERDRQQADRDVDPEDPLPGEAVGDRAADHRPAGDGEAGQALQRAHRRAAPLGREGGADERERERHHERRAHALDGAGGDQRAGVGRERAGRGRRARTAPGRRRTGGAGRSGRRAPTRSSAARRS